MKKYSVVFATDKNYIQHLAVALASLLENNKSMKFIVYIISEESQIDENNFKKLKLITEKYDAEINQILIKNEIFDKMITGYHFTKATYYRFMIPDFIEDDKVLYLDCDLAVNGSIEELFNLEFGDNYIAAVCDPYADITRNKSLHMNPDTEHFNGGVILLNNKLWKRDNISEKAIEFINKNPDIIKFPDQDGLNSVINGKWLKLPMAYNVLPFIFRKYFFRKNQCKCSLQDILEAKNNPIIMHYATGLNLRAFVIPIHINIYTGNISK